MTTTYQPLLSLLHHTHTHSVHGVPVEERAAAPPLLAAAIAKDSPPPPPPAARRRRRPTRPRSSRVPSNVKRMLPSGAQGAWPEHELQPAHSPLAGATKEVGLVMGSAGGTAASRCCSRIALSATYGSASFSAGTSTRWAPSPPLAALLVVRSPPCLAMREPRVWRSWRSRLALRIVWRARRQCAGSAPAVRQLQRLRSTQTRTALWG